MTNFRYYMVKGIMKENCKYILIGSSKRTTLSTTIKRWETLHFESKDGQRNSNGSSWRYWSVLGNSTLQIGGIVSAIPYISYMMFVWSMNINCLLWLIPARNFSPSHWVRATPRSGFLPLCQYRGALKISLKEGRIISTVPSGNHPSNPIPSIYSLRCYIRLWRVICISAC